MKLQITLDVADPDRMARFWAKALDYALHEPPDGFESWGAYWLSVGLPEEEAYHGYDAIVDPAGIGPRVWFQKVPEAKTVKSRMHFDLMVGGGREVDVAERRTRIDAKVAQLMELGATVRGVLDEPEMEYYAVGLNDPEGNEFDVA